MKNILLLITATLVALTLGILLITQEKTSQAAQLPAMAAPETPATAPGGAFTLTDQLGRPASERDFRGQLMLVYFGFTACPDMCPLAVTNISKALDALADKADQVAPLFISIDPEHDTPAALKEFLGNFNPHFVGLTGTPEQIRQVAAGYKAYYAKPAPNPVSDTAAPARIDHSGFIYLMGRDGRFISVLPPEAGAPDIVAALKPYLNQYRLN